MRSWCALPVKYRKWLTFFAFSLGFYWLGRYIIPFFWPYFVLTAGLMLPFGLAVFLSIFLEPLVGFFVRRLRFNRGLAVLLSLVSLFGGLALILSLVVGRLVFELIRLTKQLPNFRLELTQAVDVMLKKSSSLWQETNLFVQGLNPQIQLQISNNLKLAASSLERGASDILQSFLGTLQSVPSGITTFITIFLITLLATFFISKDRHSVVEFWMRLIPPPYGRKFLNIAVEVSGAFAKYLRAQAILLSMTSIVTIVGLTLIGTDYALTAGLLVGFLDLIPVLGTGTVFVPWAVWSYFAGDGVFAVKLIILYVLVVLLRQLFETKVVADSLGLHPLATLIAMYLGLRLLGFSGLFIGPILVIAVQAVVKAGVIKIKY